MPLIEELTSKRSPLVKKATKKILKDRLKGYGPYLHSALEAEIEKKKSLGNSNVLALRYGRNRLCRRNSLS